ncbi:MAG: hypothetical protein LBH04_07500 [Tannerellaceae bacterium]|nr:hypothetical protein [Tannerellaceae bacterium]
MLKTPMREWQKTQADNVKPARPKLLNNNIRIRRSPACHRGESRDEVRKPATPLFTFRLINISGRPSPALVRCHH